MIGFRGHENEPRLGSLNSKEGASVVKKTERNTAIKMLKKFEVSNFKTFQNSYTFDLSKTNSYELYDSMRSYFENLR